VRKSAQLMAGSAQLKRWPFQLLRKSAQLMDETAQRFAAQRKPLLDLCEGFFILCIQKELSANTVKIRSVSHSRRKIRAFLAHPVIQSIHLSRQEWYSSLNLYIIPQMYILRLFHKVYLISTL
jgi:hypothetical protein